MVGSKHLLEENIIKKMQGNINIVRNKKKKSLTDEFQATQK